MRAIHLVGLVLWRGGLILAAAVILFQTARWILRFVEIPLQLEIGSALLLSGMALVLLSVVLERVMDYRKEGGLRE